MDITHKVGAHYENVSVDDKFLRLQDLLQQFAKGRSLEHEIQIVKAWPDKPRQEVTYFNVATREYTKRLTKTEIDFMLFLLMPIKFYPVNP